MLSASPHSQVFHRWQLTEQVQLSLRGSSSRLARHVTRAPAGPVSPGRQPALWHHTWQRVQHTHACAGAGWRHGRRTRRGEMWTGEWNACLRETPVLHALLEQACAFDDVAPLPAVAACAACLHAAAVRHQECTATEQLMPAAFVSSLCAQMGVTPASALSSAVGSAIRDIGSAGHMGARDRGLSPPMAPGMNVSPTLQLLPNLGAAAGSGEVRHRPWHGPHSRAPSRHQHSNTSDIFSRTPPTHPAGFS